MNILSLFDGISVARVALERANIKVDKYFSSEIDKYAIQVSTKNWPDIIQLGDVKNITKDTISSYQGIVDIDLIVGGFPCQSYSISGNREGINDDRGKLVFECKRLVDELKPKFFIFENVNSMSKENKKFIDNLFGIGHIMINASLVSAQNRKRIFWVGKRVGNKYVKVEITQPEDKNIFLKDILEKEVDEKYITKMNFTKRIDYTLHKNPFDKKAQCFRASDYKGTHNMIVLDNNGKEKLKSNTLRTSGKGSGLKDKHNWDTIRVGEIGKGGQGERIYSIEGKSVNLNANGGGRGAKTGLYLVGNTNPSGNGMNGCVYDSNGKSPTLTTNKGEGNKILVNEVVRKLTPIECERLMSLDDNYTQVLEPYILDKNCDKIQVWKNVLSKIAREKNKQIVELACSITNDLKDMARLIYQNEKSKNVDIVIEMQSQEKCVTNIIKIGIGTKIHSTQIKLEKKQGTLWIVEDIKEELLTDMNIEILWKNIWGENWEEMKLCITSILIKLIIELETFICAEDQNICSYITNLRLLAENLLKEKLYLLMVKNTSLISNSQRYKCCGNAFNAEVVKHILSFIK